MKFFRICVIFAICALPSIVAAGTSYYVDPTASNNGNGSYDSPWNNIDSVNKKTFSTGDDVYFKVGTSLKVPAGQLLDIDWNGTAADHVVIGAYYGKDLFGLNGKSRPILDGDLYAPGRESYGGLIQKKSWGTQTDAYLDIRDIRIEEAGYNSILIQMVKNVTIDNCYIYHNYMSGSIVIARTDTATVSRCTIEDSWQIGKYAGAIIEVTGVDKADVTKNIVVANNVLMGGGHEGIGVYKKAKNVIVEGNIVYDVASFYIYVDAASDVLIRNNFCYGSSNSTVYGSQDWGIVIDNEKANGYCFTGEVYIYNNYIANCYNGISIATEDQNCNWNNVYVYKNIIVDSVNYNMDFEGLDAGCSNINITNNISHTISPVRPHANNYSPTGVNWNDNIFNSSVSGNATNSAHIAFLLKKESGWRYLEPESVKDASIFELTDEGKALLDNLVIKNPLPFVNLAYFFNPINGNMLAPPSNIMIY